MRTERCWVSSPKTPAPPHRASPPAAPAPAQCVPNKPGGKEPGWERGGAGCRAPELIADSLGCPSLSPRVAYRTGRGSDTQKRGSAAPRERTAPAPRTRSVLGARGSPKGLQQLRHGERQGLAAEQCPWPGTWPCSWGGCCSPPDTAKPREIAAFPSPGPTSAAAPSLRLPGALRCRAVVGLLGLGFKNTSTSGMFLASGPSPSPALVNERGRAGAGAERSQPGAPQPCSRAPCAPLALRPPLPSLLSSSQPLRTIPRSPSTSSAALPLSPVPPGFAGPPQSSPGVPLPGAQFCFTTVSLLHHLLRELIPLNPQSAASSNPRTSHESPERGPHPTESVPP